MSVFPPSIVNKIRFLNMNGFKITKDVLNIYTYDSNLSLPDSDSNYKLEYFIKKYTSKTFITKNVLEYWIDHHKFINSFEKEKEMYDKIGIDSWIYHFIKEILPSIDIYEYNKLNESFKYPLVIGFEMNQNLAYYPFELELLGKYLNVAKEFINKKKYKWANDSKEIKEFVELLNNNINGINIINNTDESSTLNTNDSCFCKSNFMIHKINNEENSYDCKYNESKLNRIHNKYCSVHSAYLAKNKSQLNNFISNKSDKWISFLNSKCPTFTDLVNNSPEDYNLHLFDIVNLFE